MNKKKEITSKKIMNSESERYSVTFDEYKKPEEIIKIQKEAEEYFDVLYDGVRNLNNCSGTFSYPWFVTAESKIIGTNVYEVGCHCREYSGMVTSTQYELKEEVVKQANPNYCKIFEERLKELAKETMTYIDIKLSYEEEMEVHYYESTLHTKNSFENKFGITLEEYYFPKQDSKVTSQEEIYKKALEELKKNYIRCMISDAEQGLPSDFIEEDGYTSLLMVNSKYKDIIDKEKILMEIGFEVNDERRTLRLIKTR